MIPAKGIDEILLGQIEIIAILFPSICSNSILFGIVISMVGDIIDKHLASQCHQNLGVLWNLYFIWFTLHSAMYRIERQPNHWFLLKYICTFFLLLSFFLLIFRWIPHNLLNLSMNIIYGLSALLFLLTHYFFRLSNSHILIFIRFFFIFIAFIITHIFFTFSMLPCSHIIWIQWPPAQSIALDGIGIWFSLLWVNLGNLICFLIIRYFRNVIDLLRCVTNLALV